jgi:hypothetical protein
MIGLKCEIAFDAVRSTVEPLYKHPVDKHTSLVSIQILFLMLCLYGGSTIPNKDNQYYGIVI